MAALVAAARTLPMMAPRRVVIVMQAEALLVPKRESDAATRALDELEALLKRPEPQTTLVLVAGAVDKRSRMYKLLVKQATSSSAGRSRIRPTPSAGCGIAWRRRAWQIEPAGGTAARRARAAPTSSGCATTWSGCCFTRWGRRRSALDDVREIVGPAALQDDWAMANAIEAGDAKAALRQLALMLDAGARPRRSWAARLARADEVRARQACAMSVEALFRTDLDLKRSAGDPRVLLERLVVEFCGRADSTGSRL